MKKIILTIIISYLPICLWGQSDTSYIGKIYENLKQIKSASYLWYQSASALYDTIPSASYNVYKKEFDNPEDEFVGVSIATFQINDTSKMVYFYDGKAQSYLDWENKTIPVDSFKNNRYPFRVVYPPFFTAMECLLKYALETSDNITIQVKELADSVLITLSVKGKLVEVVGNRIVYADPPNFEEDKWSVYNIWVNKVNNLPYRFIKRFPDRICWETCKDIRINNTDKKTFIASKYFPNNFVINLNERNKTSEKSLLGIIAPSWKLKDVNNNEFSLSDFKSKVLLIQFTGIGCGPCYQSIPHLIKIKNQYKNEEFELISIESWNNNTSIIKKHISKNEINYKYLICNDETKLNYEIQSVPRFFVLDGKRVIRKIITGFDTEKTYIELKEIIDQLLNE
ncbi:MAG: TlpA family protein disulfide reductase [Tenuifilaceae bacterium]